MVVIVHDTRVLVNVGSYLILRSLMFGVLCALHA
jgi:hypothetical protein